MFMLHAFEFPQVYASHCLPLTDANCVSMLNVSVDEKKADIYPEFRVFSRVPLANTRYVILSRPERNTALL